MKRATRKTCIVAAAIAAAMFGGNANAEEILYKARARLAPIGPDTAGLNGAVMTFTATFDDAMPYQDRFALPASIATGQTVTISGSTVGSNNGTFASDPSAFYPTFSGVYGEPGGLGMTVTIGTGVMTFRFRTVTTPTGSAAVIGGTPLVSEFGPSTIVYPDAGTEVSVNGEGYAITSSIVTAEKPCEITYLASGTVRIRAGGDAAGIAGARFTYRGSFDIKARYVDRFGLPATVALSQSVRLEGSAVDDGLYDATPSAFYPGFSGIFSEPLGARAITVDLRGSGSTLQFGFRTITTGTGGEAAIGGLPRVSDFGPTTILSPNATPIIEIGADTYDLDPTSVTATTAAIKYAASGTLNAFGGDAAGLNGAQFTYRGSYDSLAPYVDRGSRPAAAAVAQSITVTGSSIAGNNGTFPCSFSAFYPGFAGVFSEPQGIRLFATLPGSGLVVLFLINTIPTESGGAAVIGGTPSVADFGPSTMDEASAWLGAGADSYRFSASSTKGLLIDCTCPEDLNGNGMVDFGDILAVLSAWGDIGGPEDINDSGVVDFGDLLRILGGWGGCP